MTARTEDLNEHAGTKVLYAGVVKLGPVRLDCEDNRRALECAVG